MASFLPVAAVTAALRVPKGFPIEPSPLAAAAGSTYKTMPPFVGVGYLGGDHESVVVGVVMLGVALPRPPLVDVGCGIVHF